MGRGALVFHSAPPPFSARLIPLTPTIPAATQASGPTGIKFWIYSHEVRSSVRACFFGKIQKRICDLPSMDSSASKQRKIRKRIIFHDNGKKQTNNKPRVACNLKNKKKQRLAGLLWRNSSMKMPPEKKCLSD